MSGRRRPPPPRAHRAARRPLVFEYLRRWYSTGIDLFERAQLTVLGYERWLKRSRLTADMTAALLLHALDELEYFATDRASAETDRRTALIENLQARRPMLSMEEQRLLAALRKLEKAGHDRHLPLFIYDRDADSVRIAPEPPEIANAWDAVQRQWPHLIQDLWVAIIAQRTSTKTVKLGDNVIHLGEQAGYGVTAKQLRKELGAKFLSAEAKSQYRAERVRKWKQLALAGEPRRS
jgi:hypothetical protein